MDTQRLAVASKGAAPQGSGGSGGGDRREGKKRRQRTAANVKRRRRGRRRRRRRRRIALAYDDAGAGERDAALFLLIAKGRFDAPATV